MFTYYIKGSALKTDIFVGPCDGKPCSGKGRCILTPGDTTDGHTCACNAGYTGANCEKSKSYTF